MKKLFCIVISMMLLLFFLLSPAQALSASRGGLMLWFTQLLPTLLPFTVLSFVILHSGMFDLSASPQTHSLGLREWYVILCGFLFGFPIGSKLTADLYSQGQLSREKATVLFVFTNNLSPVFVTSVFQEQLHRAPGILVFVLLYGIPFVYGLLQLARCRRRIERKKRQAVVHRDPQKNTASRFELNMQIIDAGIINGFETLIKICGYVMIFSLTAELLKMLPLASDSMQTLLIGLIEVTNGMSALVGLSVSEETRYLLAIFFLSWGGLSGLFQTASIVSHTDLAMKHYLAKRLLLVFFTVTAAALLLRIGVW